MWFFKNLILIILVFNTYAFAYGSPSIALNSDQESFDVDAHSLEVFQDHGGNLNIEDIVKLNKGFKKNGNKVLGFGFSKAAIWVKLPIQNKSVIKDWVLTVNFPDLDELIFYKKKSGVWTKSYAGDSISTKKWEYLYKDYIFNLDGEGPYYLRVKSRGALSIPLKIMAKKSFLNLRTKNHYFFGGYFSILGFCIVYNFIMALFLRSKSFLYYGGYLCGVTWMTLILSGVGRAFLIDSVWFSNEGFVFSLIVFFFFYLLFTKSFLNVEGKFEGIKKYYDRSLICIGLFLFIAPFVPLTYNLNLIAFYAIPSIGTTFFTAIYLFKENREARLYVYAFLIVLLGGLFKTLNALGLIPSTFIIEIMIFVGFIIQVTILSFGLADIINTLLEKTTLAEKRLVDANFELEERVKDRTKSLEESVEKINQLLNNIKQGIFLVDQNNKIADPVSTFTEEIFEENIERKDIFDTVFKDMDKKSSEYGDFNFSISCIYNQDVLQWLVLKDCYPEKIHFTSKNGKRKKIKLSYNPIFENDKITHIMYITEDITELEKLELEAKEKEKEKGRYVEILQELSNNKRESLKVYFTNTFKLSRDCQNIVNKISHELVRDPDNKELKFLLQKLHTIKGDSLIYGFNSLSTFVHEVETELIESNFEFVDVEGEDKLESAAQKIYELNGMIVSYALCANDVFQLKFDEIEHYFQDLHKAYSLMEYSLFRCLGSIPKITVDPDVSNAFLGMELRDKLKEKLIHDLQNLKYLCLCLNEKEIVPNISDLEKKVKDKDFDKIELFDDFQKVSINAIKKIEIEIVVRTLSKKGIQAKSINDNVWAEAVYNFYALYKNLGSFQENEYSKILDNLKNITKKTESSYLEMTVALVKSLLLRKEDVKPEVYLKIFIKEAFLFLIVIIQTQKNGKIFISLLKKLDEEKIKVDAFYLDLTNLMGMELDEIVTCFGTPQEIVPFLDKFFVHIEKGNPEHALLTLINDKVIEDEHPVSKIFKDFFEKERFRWGSYIGQIEVAQFSNSFFKNDSLEDIVKPEVLEVLPENLVYVKDILLENGQFSDDNLVKVLNLLFESPLKYSLNKFQNMVNQVSSDLGKKVDFKLTGDQGSLAKEKLALLEEAMVHIIRNSLDHGIEDPKERTTKGKPEKGLLEIGCKEEKGDLLRLVIKDDGKGINVDKLCEKAISIGVLKAEEVEQLSEEEKLNIIFLPSISTKEDVSEISGRGIGMDVVKNSLEVIGATLTIESNLDKGTTFIIDLPKTLKLPD